MALYSYLNEHEKPTQVDLENCLDGNLCRCTGYRPLLDAAKSFACDRPVAIQYEEEEHKTLDSMKVCSSNSQSVISSFENYSNTCSIPFPEELKSLVNGALDIKGRKCRWIRPQSLQELVNLKAEHPAAKIITGNTEVGIETKFKNCNYPIVIHASDVPELTNVIRI